MTTKSSEFVTNEKYIHLNHCGVQRIYSKDIYNLRMNGRMDYHIVYIYEGLCHAEFNGEPQVIEEGNVLLFKPGEKQIYSFHKTDRTISCYIHFTGNGCEDFVNQIGFKDCGVINIGKSRTIFSLFEKMETEQKFGHPFSQALCEAYILEILALIGRKYRYSQSGLLKYKQNQIDIAIQYIFDNYTQSISVADCAKKCNLSVDRFAHNFKEITGKAPLEYITELRISKAKDLLLSTDYSMSEIAERVGFSSQNYFARIFKKHTGLSPQKYVRQETEG